MPEYSAITVQTTGRLVLAKVFEFARYRRNQRRLPRRGRRLLNAPWQPLAALIGVAAALWFAADLRPDAVGGNGALVLRGNGAAQPRENGAVALRGNGAGAMDGSGVFTLCIRANQQNCVIDGDTIRYRGLKIRLEDIDAPEVFSPNCRAEAELGRESTRRLLELINEGPFELVRAGDRDEDRYGRKLRTIARNGRSVGHTLVAEGLARRWDGARRTWCG
jgi:endonuclease YncB( thermonuclease family)